jgi:hypothetical protein
MYYNVKLNWTQPKEGTDEMQNVSKQFLVEAESCTEAEAKVINWTPRNYQDAVVEEVKKTNIGELRLKGDSETFWLIKIMEDMDGTTKPKPYLVVYDGNHLEDAVRKATSDWTSDLEDVKRFKVIVDEDLIQPGAISYSKKELLDDSDVDVLDEEEEEDIEEDNA